MKSKDLMDVVAKSWEKELLEEIYKPSTLSMLLERDETYKRPSWFQRFKNRWSMRLYRIKKAWRVLRGNELD